MCVGVDVGWRKGKKVMNECMFNRVMVALLWWLHQDWNNTQAWLWYFIGASWLYTRGQRMGVCDVWGAPTRGSQTRCCGERLLVDSLACG